MVASPYQIRPYEKKDFRYVQDICMANFKHIAEDAPVERAVTPTERAVICSMFCDYYLDNQSDYCYVAVDGDDIPVGYLLCSVDVDDYNDNMSERYLPPIRKLSGGDYYHYSAEIKVCGRYVRQGYTAHLHINVRKEHRRKGLGSEMLRLLEGKLTEMYVEGLYLVCGQTNVEGRAFFQKHGYEDIDFLSGAVVFGKKFYTED